MLKKEEQLHDISELAATSRAFAAVSSSGEVVTWGDRDFGGDSRQVQPLLTEVQQLCGAGAAFAALKTERFFAPQDGHQEDIYERKR